MLFKKMFRDIGQNLSQFFAIFLMIFLQHFCTISAPLSAPTTGLKLGKLTINERSIFSKNRLSFRIWIVNIYHSKNPAN